MRLAILLHHPDETPDVFADALLAEGAKLDLYAAHEGALPNAKAYQGFVLMGGPQSAGDAQLAAERAWLRATLARGAPVLGVCLGAQLMALAAGGAVLAALVAEWGIHEVQLTEAGSADPLFSGWPARFPVFQWHADTWRLPPGAVRLCTGEKVPEQAFRLGRGQYALQFHLEPYPETVARWAKAHPEGARRLGDASTWKKALVALHPRAAELAVRWLALIRR